MALTENRLSSEKSTALSPANFADPVARAQISKAVMKLFDHWALSDAEQLSLLGFNEGSRKRLANLRRGTPIPNNIDTLDRVGHLFSIHKNLRLLLPHDRDIVYQWIKFPNVAFNKLSPLQVMLEYRLVGIVKVRLYLEKMAGM